jgi:3'-phosphoadenosine 5'-phosphosulfate sulfotransferase (PAPS reductase)/FAD synthetase
MFIKEDDLKLQEWEFAQRKYLPYETKLILTKTRIKEWYENWGGDVYISYSGGLDSTVLLDLVRKTIGDYVPAVFSNTGLEFPEIVRFARKASGEYIEVYPTDKKGKRITFKQVVNQYGFPLISKETALKIQKLRHGNLSERYRNYLLNGDERGKFGVLAKKWQFLLTTQFDTSEMCCHIMKKNPFRKYEKETGCKPYIGVTQDEGFMRAHQYAHTGCNVYDGNIIKSQPLGFWTRQDVLRYVVENDLLICSVYGDVKQTPCGEYYTTGEQRTGCMFCGFGTHLERCPNRFQRMLNTHPKHYQICMNLENNGVKYRDALTLCGIEVDTWRSIGQMEIEDFPEYMPDDFNKNDIVS